MEYLLVYDKQYEERALLIAELKDSTAMLSDASLGITECDLAGEVQAVLAGENPLDLAVVEIAEHSDVDLSRALRGRKKDLEMMLVAEQRVSPMEYLTPEIRACSLLLRPWEPEEMKKVVRKFMGEFFRNRETVGEEEALIIENRDGKITVPYRSIYYIEVRGKKLHVRLQDKEYTMYESLENIRKVLPAYFQQSHRSFLFNSRYLERVRLSENLLYLSNEILIPLSRTFKSQIKELMNVE